MGRPVVHWEFWSDDPQKVSEFYEKVFDWGIRHIPEMDYRMVETGGEGGINGGIMKPKAGPLPANLAFYIDVDDLDAYGAKVTEAGGKLVVEKMDIPGVGQLSLFEDPDGRVIGMWKQAAPGGAEGEDFTMEVVTKTNNQGLLAIFETVLNGAEIPYFIRGAEAASLMPVNATVVVPSRHAEAAKELLRETEEAHETG
jgi:predicted enzyme related to lactoylglutathione lyase